MSIIFRDIADYRREGEQLYMTSFPREERPPLRRLYKAVEKGYADFRVMERDGAFAGIAYIVGTERVKTLMFFAVPEGLRGTGVGSETLQLLRKEWKDIPFYLCSEPEDPMSGNAAQRTARLRFYRSNHFLPSGLHVREYGVPFTVLTDGGTPLTFRQYREATAACFGKLRFLLFCHPAKP